MPPHVPAFTRLADHSKRGRAYSRESTHLLTGSASDAPSQQKQLTAGNDDDDGSSVKVTLLPNDGSSVKVTLLPNAGGLAAVPPDAGRLAAGRPYAGGLAAVPPDETKLAEAGR